MCGFLGCYSINQFNTEFLKKARLQSAKLSTRGNTSKGEWHQENVALYHYRLAFRDIGSGHQPMLSRDGNEVIIFNGEIYDFRSLRKLLSYDFLTDSDTEVLLALWKIRGEKFLDNLDGEYAFAIWDQQKSKLVAARDPFGIKPLYLASSSFKEVEQFRTFSNHYTFELDNEIFLSSEIKGIPMQLHWDQEGLRRQFVGLYEEMATPWQGVIQIPPGALFTAEKRNGKWLCAIQRKIVKARTSQTKLEKLDFYSEAKNLRSLVEKSVRSRLDADVPLGAYLSGGVDSRAIVYEMWKSGYRFPTFTVGFTGADYDESHAVKKFLEEFPGIKGYLLKTTNESLEYAYRHAVYASELIQPYTNGSAKWWLSKFARKYVQGVLTGDGADELFCGYPSYRYLAWWNFYQKNPSSLRARLYAKFSEASLQKPWETGTSSGADGADLRASFHSLGWYHPLFQQISTLTNWYVGSEGGAEAWFSQIRDSLYSFTLASKNASSKIFPLETWQNYFLYTHFPTHVLNWVGDRMEMANTLEGRPPLLSKEILEFQRKLPNHFFVRGLRDKAIFRKAYEDLGKFSKVPKKQFNAPFLWDGELGKEFLTEEKIKAVSLIDWDLFKKIRVLAREEKNSLLQSYANIFLQNSLVIHLLDHSLVRGETWERDHAWEDEYLQKNTEQISK